MNDFIKGYPSSPSSSGEMFDDTAFLLSARNAVQHALFTRAHARIQSRDGDSSGLPTEHCKRVVARDLCLSVGRTSLFDGTRGFYGSLETTGVTQPRRNDVSGGDEKSSVVINERRKIKRRTSHRASRNVRVPQIISMPR
jgi:hypothetical protein